jgi:predicted ribosome quality control (RQC) complex YloA/Tae2 family protein
MKPEKKELSSLEIYYLVNELKRLENSKVDRIYNTKEEKNKMLIVLHVAGSGKNFLEIVLPGLIVMKDSKESYENPTGFCMMLRKYLEGSILRKINQINFERVVELEFESRTNDGVSRYFIFLELFSKGNMIFCDEKKIILNIFEERHWKDRELKRGEKYVHPKSSYDPLSIGEKDFIAIIKDSDKESIVKTLAIELSLGGVYAEEACKRSDINKNLSPKTIDAKKILLIYKKFKDMLNEPIKANFTGGNILPFELETFSGMQPVHFDSFNDAISAKIISGEDKSVSKHNTEIEKIQSIIAQQEDNLRSAEAGYSLNSSKAESIYSNYQMVDNIIKTIRDARKKYSWKEIKEKISADKKLNVIIKDINEKNSEVTISVK